MDNENKVKSKSIKKNVYQKFFAFRTNFFNEFDSKDYPNVIKKLAEEQECFVFYSDDVIATEKGNYISSEIHFVDVDTGEEIAAKSVVLESQKDGDNTKRSRGFALKALLGYVDNLKGSDDKSDKKSKEQKTVEAAKTSSSVPLSPTRCSEGV